ncbi:MAG: hypothetical protein ABI175_11895 [Polyangiales bacterium]
METEEPRELSSLLGDQLPLDPDYAVSIILGCCTAGAALGDLRWWSESLGLDWSPLPAHILVSQDRKVRMRPHGIQPPRSFAYLSPKRADGAPWDERGWVFAFGAVLWEMLAGQPLFAAANDYATVVKVRAARVPPLRDVPPALDAIVRKALARDPALRYQTLAELAAALVALAPAREPGSPYRT